MVDPTKGIGTAGNIPASDKPQPRVKRGDGADEVQKKRQDEIASRQRDLSVAEAEQTAQDTSKQLENSKHNLGLGQGFDQTV